MSNVVRTAGVAGNFNYTLSQVPAETPTLTIYSDAARTIVAVPSAPLVATANPAVFTATYPATLAAGTYFLSFSVVMTAGQPAFIDNDDTLELQAVSGGVDTAAFATPAELATYLRRALTPEEAAAAELVLGIASDTIRTFTRQTLSRATTTARLVTSTGGSLVLPERPVVSVAAVEFEGTALAPSAYSLVGNTLRWTSGWYDRYVDVTYTHGFDPIPDDIKGICLELAGGAIVSPADGVKAESIVNYSVTFDTLASGTLSESQKDRLRPYRATITSAPIAAGWS